MKVLVGDHHAIIRAGLRSIIERRPGHVVVEATDESQFLRLAREFAPDVGLLNLALPERGGVSICATLAQDCPRLPLIVLADSRTDHRVVQAVTAGAVGCVTRDAAPSDVVAALDAAHRGDRRPSSESRPSPGPARVTFTFGAALPQNALTARQREVLRLLAEGHSSKEAAGLLGLSSKTIDVHRGQIMRKLGIRSMADLVRYALRHGMIAAEAPPR